VAAVSLISFLFTLPNKVLLQQFSGALLALANPFHVWGHHLVLGGKILAIEELVNLNSSSFPIFHPSTSSPTSLNQSSWLVVWAQENDNINVSQVDTKKHLVAGQVKGNL
jgi:hypothetical protein